MQEVLASEEAFTLDYAEIINENNFEKALQSDVKVSVQLSLVG